MRTSSDIYKLPNGTLVPVSQMEEAPIGATLWQGYDYTNQYWVFEGQRDTRTLEQLREAMEMAKA